ncbi:MAG: ABC transporter permease [Acidobacteria bacterium]|nr:ABC transporter permease [Acidobacteriota bacterium]
MMRLFRTFIVRRLVMERLRSLTTIIGIALGVAVVIAIQLANASSVRGFETALDTMSGRTSLEVVGSVAGIDERVLPDVGWLRTFGTVSPVIEGDMAVVLADGRTEAMRVLGVDILRDTPIRDYRILSNTAGAAPGGVPVAKLLEMLTSPRSVVIAAAFAGRHGYAVGDSLPLISGDRVQSFVVGGLLADEGPARVLDGNFVLMDIAAAQLAFDRLGRIDRIDVRLREDLDVGEAIAAVAARLPAGLDAQRPGRRGEQVERMLAAFHMNLTALSWIALIVGLFLVYNTVTISVVARRGEIGMLRALGVTRGQVVALFLGEAAAFGLVGAAAGLGLARLLADAALALTSSTVSTLYIAVAAAPPAIGLAHVALAFGIGVPLSLVAAFVPAHEAARVPPTAAIRGADTLDTRFRLRRGLIWWPLALLGLAAWFATLDPVGRVPLFGYVSSLAVIVGAALLAPAVLFGLARMSRRPLRRLWGVEGLLAHANLVSAIPRLSISVAALAVALSMMVAIAVMIGSFRETVSYWVGQTLQADLFVSPGMRAASGVEQTISPDVVAGVAGHPDVLVTDSFRNTEIVYDGDRVVLGAGSFDVVATHGSLLFKSPADGLGALRSAVGQDAVIVSEAFSTKFGVHDGDGLTLPTPAGPRTFRVAAVYYDYATERGVIVMDRGTFTRHFGDLAPTGVSAYLRQDADADAVRSQILDGLPDGRRVFIYTNRNLRTEILRIFDSTFSITYALEIIAVFVAMLGVAGTLLTLVIERRHDLALLRLVGADRRQVRRMVVLEAGLIGLVSQAIAIGMGLALSLVLIYVINVQSFGWTIQFHLPIVFLVQASIAVVVATAVAGIYPARRAADMGLVREE